MKAIVSKKTGETLVFCEQKEVDSLKNIKGILIFDATQCPCGRGWVVDRKPDTKLKRS